MGSFELYGMCYGIVTISTSFCGCWIGLHALLGLVELAVVVLQLLTPLRAALVAFGLELLGEDVCARSAVIDGLGCRRAQQRRTAKKL